MCTSLTHCMSSISFMLAYFVCACAQVTSHAHRNCSVSQYSIIVPQSFHSYYSAILRQYHPAIKHLYEVPHIAGRSILTMARFYASITLQLSIFMKSRRIVPHTVGPRRADLASFNVSLPLNYLFISKSRKIVPSNFPVLIVARFYVLSKSRKRRP